MHISKAFSPTKILISSTQLPLTYRPRRIEMSFSSTTQSLNFTAISETQSLFFRNFSSSQKWRSVVTMKGRSTNPRPLQKGRILSIEAIQTIQALKRAQNHSLGLDRAFESKFRRLLKLDMIAVLRELLRQNECLLALKVFDDVRKEHWYKPQVSLYAEIIGAFGRNGLFDQVEIVVDYLKRETNLKPDIEGFNTLFRTLIDLKLAILAMDCYYLMKQFGSEPDRTSFRILINGLESIGKTGFSGSLRLEAQSYYGESMDFLLEDGGLELTR